MNSIKNLQNLHTHTTYCDGVNTPEEMLEIAIKKGFSSLGFSGHSYMAYSPSYSMSMIGTDEYIRHINRLEKEYRDRIEIFCGIEFDMFSGIDLSGFDYILGAVHYLKIGDETVGFDRSAKEVKTVIDTYFGGDGLSYAKAYYETLSLLPEYCDADVVAHFDLVTKHSETENFFDTESKLYRNYAISAAEALAGKIPLFEVNTGAIARGYRTTPYPDSFLLKELKRLGFGAIISSDCHNGEFLDCGFQDARELLIESGFKERYILTANGFRAVEL